MNTNKDEKKKTKAGSGAGALLAGAALAAVAGGYYLFGSKNAKENRKKIEGWTLKAKGEVLTKVEKAKELTKEKYETIVDGVTDKYAKVKDVGEEKSTMLNQELKRHWSAMKREIDEKTAPKKKATTTVKKITKKAGSVATKAKNAVKTATKKIAKKVSEKAEEVAENIETKS